MKGNLLTKTRNKALCVRITEGEYDLIARLAYDRRMSYPDLIMSLVLKEIKTNGEESE